jgi:cytochrome P450
MCHEFNEVKEIVQYRTLYMINQVKFLDQLPFWGKNFLDETAKKLNEFVNQSIADRRSGKSKSLCSGEDILDLLLSAVDDQGQLYLLVMKQLEIACREEVDRIFPNGIIPTFEHMADLQVIEAVLYETLCLYLAAPIFACHGIKEHTIGSSNGKVEICIPVGAVIIIHSYFLHRREKYWPRPLEFDYQRWMRDSVTGLKPKLAHPYAYLPFAAGSRNCIGQNFALLEA